MKTAAKHTRGQSLVEFALVIPMLLLLMVGILEFSRAWMTKNVLTGAAREGARAAAVGGDGVAAANLVLTSASITTANVAVAPSGSPYGPVTVTVTYDFPVSVPGFFSRIIALVTRGTATGSLPEWDAATIPLGSSTTMRKEY